MRIGIDSGGNTPPWNLTLCISVEINRSATFHRHSRNARVLSDLWSERQRRFACAANPSSHTRSASHLTKDDDLGSALNFITASSSSIATIFIHPNAHTSTMNNLPPEVLCHILEISAEDIVDRCMQIQGPTFDESYPYENRSTFMGLLTDYGGLCRVNRLFHHFITCARVEGKLLKTTLMDISITRFLALVQMTELPEDREDFRRWKRRVGWSCGSIWRNPRLWTSLPSLLRFCDKSYSSSYESPSKKSHLLAAELLYWIPITFQSQMIKTADLELPWEAYDFAEDWDKRHGKRTELGRHGFKIRSHTDEALWVGVSLEGPLDSEEEKEWKEGTAESVPTPYWLWWRYDESFVGVDNVMTYIVDYAYGEVTQSLRPDLVIPIMPEV
jgi:hypothetical protein